MSTSFDLEDRRELYRVFQHTIEGTYSELLEEQELNYKQNMLKTFLVESNIEPSSLGEQFKSISVQKIDYDLFELLYDPSKEKENEETKESNVLTFYLDSQDERFWTIYSLERSSDSKDAIDKLIVSEGSGLDYLWFPAQLQRYLTTLGEFLGAGINYDAEDVFSDEYVEDHLPFGELSLQSSGHGTQWLLDALSDANLKRFMALSSVRIRRELEDSFVIERVDNKGRITTRGGDDIQAHLTFIDKLRNLYGGLIREIEANSRISYPSRIIGDNNHESQGQTIEGSPMVINLTNEIDDIERFAKSFTSATKPLRLWGTGTWLSEDYYKVRGTDLHNNDSFTLEIKREWIRLYLPEDACGNTALRIFSNIQRYYDAEASFGEQSSPEETTVKLSA